MTDMTAEDLRKSILQQAIQGKLVPQNPDDEPASVLLERIQAEKARLVKEKKIKKDKNESRIYRTKDGHWMEHFEDKSREDVCIDDEIPFDVPSGWEWCRLGSISTIIGGYAYKSQDFIKFSKNQVLRLGNVKNDSVKLENSPVYISDDIANQTEKFRCHLDDILITMTGTRKKRDYFFSYKIEKENLGWFINQRVGALRFYINKISNFMIYVLKSETILQDVFQYETGTANQGNLGAENIAKVYIPLPPLAEQKRIVERIEELMAKVEEYEKSKVALDKLESGLQPNLKKSILQYAIQGKLVPQNPDDEPASVLLERIRTEKARLVKEKKIKKDKNESVIFRGDNNSYYEKLADGTVKCIDEEIPFEIPENWEWVRFRDMVQFSLGKTPERVDSTYWTSNEVPWVSIADMEDKSILTKTKEFISQKALTEKFNNTFSPIGTLIMSFKLTIGKVSILGINAVHNEAIISIYPFINDNNITRNYLFNFLSIITGYTASTDAIKGATLNSKKMSEMLVPLPPLAEQKRIVAALEAALSGLDKIPV